MLRFPCFLKTCFLSLILIVITGEIKSQVVPTSQINPNTPLTVNPTPVAHGAGSKINFVRSFDASIPQVDPLEIVSATRTFLEVKRNSQYFDGLGRPLQAVSWKASPTGGDIVVTSIYDEYGRETYRYLPYAAASTDGLFKYSSFSEQNLFYKNLYDANNGGEKVYYEKSEFESSPSAKVTKKMAAGNSWAGSGRGVTNTLELNILNEVINWSIGSTPGSVPSSLGYYAPGVLVKSVSTDEDGKRVIVYKDKNGNIILRKIDNGSTDLITHANWICTYYVYDNLNNLRFVLQPRATEWLRNNNWTFESSLVSSSNVAKEFCFIYEYDGRSRVIQRKVPGAAEIFMVYDKRDRLIMSQNGNQRVSNQWMVTKYDDLSRPIKTGIITSAATHGTHQSSANSDLSYPTLNSADILTEMYYDDYSWVPAGVAGISNSLDMTYVNNTNFLTTYNSSPEYALPITMNTMTVGMSTGMKIRVIGTSSFLYTVNFYDEFGREIQSRSSNISTGGYQSITNQYDFEGKLLRKHIFHTYTSGTTQNYQVLTKLIYNNGRLETLKKSINGGADKTIAGYEYDELGRVKKKKLGTKPQTTSTPLEVQEMSYNIRGWVNGINKKFANAEVGVENFFGMTLDYDFGFTQNQYNGNIAGSKWRSQGDWDQRAYGFTYDQSNRLKKADFTQNSSSGWNTSAGINYNLENINYDLNGNITQLKQWGLKGINSTVVDELDYKYLNNDFSNKLLSVKELIVGNQDNQLGDFTDKNTSLDDYTYDNNGNLTTDKNKNILSITYNYLNLPSTITTSKGTITYTYDATGNKLKKEVNETAVGTKTTTYISEWVYENNILQFIAHEEGRTRLNANGTAFVHDYFLKDHLGNIRMVLTEEEKTDQYPTLSFEGTAGSQTVTDQNGFWENANGQSVNVTGTRVAWPSSFYATYNPSQDPNHINGLNAVLLKKSIGAVKASKLMKVMSGDRLHVKVDYYHNTTSANNAPANGLTSMINALFGAISGTNTSGALLKSQASTITSGLNSNSDVTTFFGPQSGSGGTTPKAYLHVLLFDERFKFDKDNSYVQQVSGATGKNSFDKSGLNAVSVKKNGYAFVYVSNESENDIYFDNFMLTHERGRILEETHYYPFGLTLAGLSSKAVTFGGAPNKFKITGKEEQRQEFGDGSGLDWLDFGARMYDAQIGRFNHIDPLSDAMPRFSPYNYVFNIPNRLTDPTGMAPTIEGSADDILYSGSMSFMKKKRGSYENFVKASIEAHIYAELNFNHPEIEKTFYEIWDKASTVEDVGKKNEIYLAAFTYLYNAYSNIFMSVASQSQFYLEFGLNRGKDSKAFMKAQFDPDNEISKNRRKYGVTVFKESIKEISDRVYSFGYIVRAFFHELVHVNQRINNITFNYSDHGESEFQAYFRTLQEKRLPAMTLREASADAISALIELRDRLPREARNYVFHVLYKKELEIFYTLLDPQQIAIFEKTISK